MKDPDKIQRTIGTLQKKHSKVQRYYNIELRGGSALVAERKEAQMQQALELCGDYILKTDKQLGIDYKQACPVMKSKMK